MTQKISVLILSAALLIGGCTAHQGCKDGACTACKNRESRHMSVDKTPAYFAFDSSTLSTEDKENLRHIVARLKANPDEKVRISGYTDNTGPANYNMRLSKHRAMSAAKYLEDHGITSDRIKVVGYGASHFADPNTTAAGRARNRRIEVSFYQ